MKLSLQTRVAIAALSCATALVAAPAAGAETVPAQLRVLSSSGEQFADVIQYTGPTKITTNTKAGCFGEPTSGDSYRLADANALGVLSDAERRLAALRPVLITDAFFGSYGSFGVCGISGIKAQYIPYDPMNPQPTPYWYLAVEGVAASAGPNQIPLSSGDDVLYYFTQGDEPSPPDQLVLKAPERAPNGQVKVTVRVIDSGTGKSEPALGAEVDGVLTDKNGKATIEAGSDPAPVLQATRGQDVPSSLELVCVADGCQPPGERILGSPKRDQIKGTNLRDRINPGAGKDLVDAGAGNDSVNAKRNGRDVVDCGAGNGDRASLSGKDEAVNCETVKRV